MKCWDAVKSVLRRKFIVLMHIFRNNKALKSKTEVSILDDRGEREN